MGSLALNVMKNVLRIAVFGCKGRMGRAVIEEIEKDPKLSYAGGADLGTSDGEISDMLRNADIAVDFSSRESAPLFANHCADAGVPFVCGVTGLSPESMSELEAAGKSIPVLWSPNMSVAVNISMAVCALISQKLSDFDIHIHEIHHTAKKDSPSGTAINYAKAIKAACGKMPAITSARIGGETGTHTVSFGGPYESLEITHRAGNRALFASGSILAAKWLYGRNPGIYSFADMLGISGIYDGKNS